MKTINLTHPGGVGDGIMMSSYIKEKYCKEYDFVHLIVPRLNNLFKGYNLANEQFELFYYLIDFNI